MAAAASMAEKKSTVVLGRGQNGATAVAFEGAAGFGGRRRRGSFGHRQKDYGSRLGL